MILVASTGRSLRWVVAGCVAAIVLASCGDDGSRTSSIDSKSPTTNFVDVHTTKIITAEQVMRDRERLKQREKEREMLLAQQKAADQAARRGGTPGIPAGTPGTPGTPGPGDATTTSRNPVASPGGSGGGGGTGAGAAPRDPTVASGAGGGSGGSAAPGPMTPRPVDPVAGGGSGGSSATGASAGEPETVWTVVLATTTGDGHAQQALAVANNIRAAAPQVGDLWLHGSERGSMVLSGRFGSVDDPAAQAHLRFIKEMRVEDRTPFVAARLAPVRLGQSNAAHPHDLRTLRRQFPKVDPLYTLDVAVWIAEENDASWRDCRRRAEAYAAQLRAQGYEAYFYHDETQRITSVTVGKFDRTAVNPVSHLYTPDVRKLMAQFPQRLVNGEPMIDPKSRVTQQPAMVRVPVKLD